MNADSEELLFLSIFKLELMDGRLYSSSPYTIIDDNSKIVEIEKHENGWLFGCIVFNPLGLHGFGDDWKIAPISLDYAFPVLKTGIMVDGMDEDRKTRTSFKKYLDHIVEGGLTTFHYFYHASIPRIANSDSDLDFQLQLNSKHRQKNATAIYMPKGCWLEPGFTHSQLIICTKGEILVVMPGIHGKETWHLKQGSALFVPCGSIHNVLAFQDSEIVKLRFIHMNYMSKSLSYHTTDLFDKYGKQLWSVCFNAYLAMSATPPKPASYFKGFEFLCNYLGDELMSLYVSIEEKHVTPKITKKDIDPRIFRPTQFLKSILVKLEYDLEEMNQWVRNPVAIDFALNKAQENDVILYPTDTTNEVETRELEDNASEVDLTSDVVSSGDAGIEELIIPSTDEELDSEFEEDVESKRIDSDFEMDEVKTKITPTNMKAKSNVIKEKKIKKSGKKPLIKPGKLKAFVNRGISDVHFQPQTPKLQVKIEVEKKKTKREKKPTQVMKSLNKKFNALKRK